MSEFWVSQGNTWCKYCKKWISSNTHQIRQHEAGDKHIAAEEAFIKALSSKAVRASSRETKSATAVNAGSLLERISKARAAAAAPPPELATAPEAPEENAYPAPAGDVIGAWVAVEPTEKAEVNEVPVAEKEPEEEAVPQMRVGATDAADEEEALAREAAAHAALVASKANDDEGDAIPVFKKRAISKSRKRQRRRK